ncbi:Predicted dinucleotide-utilizing enzyme [Sphingomonas laterariae]|uniref:Predicted dinucleotide-utilizing enzyme n=1 Tax=Edaphosphingomonas laterariae TaxID=861865 RepID=A0A239CWF6_9SPHN|nr:aspartate dehydrogenase domain-containing protein [Sphingomonas laterariae]SNS24098.1 Predicted dinucleotide-utilizing enzyme [Sphingomonas laterariae]
MAAMRIGLIGFGFIGAEIYDRIAADPGALDIAFVHNRSRDRLCDIPADRILDDLADAHRFAPDLIVEMAGPEITRRHGEGFLAIADYMPLSLTALADDDLRERLEQAARDNGHSLLIAHGALVGMDSLLEWQAMWDHVTISFRKPPASLGQLPSTVTEPTLLFDGNVREIAARYPHNVNAMVACALATVGLDRCRARLIADPAIDHLELTVEALGRDGTRLAIERRQPAKGVSGSEMAAAVHHSILRAAGIRRPLAFA